VPQIFFQKEWKFFSFGTQTSSKFAGGSGAEPKPKTFFKSFLGKKFELDRKSSSRRKIAILKAPAPTLFAVESWRFCFGESSSFERSSKLNEIQQPIFCIFAYGETSKFSESKRKRQFFAQKRF